MANVYQVEEGWSWQDLKNGGYSNGAKTLGMFQSKDLAVKYVKQLNLTQLHRDGRASEYYRVDLDEICPFFEMTKVISRVIVLIGNDDTRESYGVDVIEHEVIEELD